MPAGKCVDATPAGICRKLLPNGRPSNASFRVYQPAHGQRRQDAPSVLDAAASSFAAGHPPLSISLDLTRASAPVQGMAKTPVNLSGLTRDELRQALIDAGIRPPEKARMRASQVWRWIHHYGVTDFALMSDVAKETRARLAEAFTLARPEIVERQVSKDGTRKWLIRTAPGIEIETVYIPDLGRAGALCGSSQVGCTPNCTFCHTGTQKLVRNLTAAEIVAQVQVARDDLGEWPSPKEDRRLSNIVFMGMGEPLYNLDHVADAIDIIADNEGIAISRRRITVS